MAIPMPTDVYSIIGTPVTARQQVIDISNVDRLKKVAQWGRGSILSVAFTPDGSHFIAASELGWSIYDVNALDQAPLWVGFSEPAIFNQFYFSANGAYAKFVLPSYPTKRTVFRRFPSGDLVKPEGEISWLEPDGFIDYGKVISKSPDDTKIFKSTLTYEFEETLFTEEKSIREMYDGKNNLLYSLRDDAPYVSYSDRNGPEGCDLSVFSPCGNALMAVATTPIKVLFSSGSNTFAALYDTPGLFTGIMKAYSFIRVYDSESGDLIGSIGGFTKPVQDFDYSPDGKRLVVGFVDGSIILWDVQNAETTFGSRHMNAPLWELEYSHDSQYLLIKREEEVEVRHTTSGSLLYRFDAVDFAVSPASNLIALGDEEGSITIRDMDTGEGIRKIEAHDARIYSLAFSPNGRYLASSGQDCNIKLWDVNTGELLHYFEETAVDPYVMEMTSRIFSTYLEFIPNTNMLIGFGSWGTVVNWNIDSGATNYTIQSAALDTYTVKPEFPEFFDTDIQNNTFYVNNHSFNLSTGEKLGEYEEPANLPKGCSPIGPVSKDGQLLFTVGYNRYDGAEICILNPSTYDLVGTISVVENEVDERSDWVNWLYLSPDGQQLLATVGSGIVYVYQIVE
jgi:WD40 repeat protein